MIGEDGKSDSTADKKNGSSIIPARHRQYGPNYYRYLSEEHYRRLDLLNKSQMQFVCCLSVRRCRMLNWIWDWINLDYVHDWKEPDPDGLEQILIAGERLLDMRKHKKSQTDISQAAANYILQQRGPCKKRYIEYLVGQILWSFYERYPKSVPTITKNKDGLQTAIKSIISFTDRDLSHLIPEVATLVPAVRGGLVEDHFGNWSEGSLGYLCRRVLNLLNECKNLESAYTIKIRQVLTSHVDLREKRKLYEDALQLSKSILGPYHHTTWELTECLGKFYLSDAPEYMLNYYCCKFKGDKVKSTLDLYETFLSGARSSGDKYYDLVGGEVAPALAELYIKHGDERKGRSLLWEVSKEKSAQIYKDHWCPFERRGFQSRLVQALRAAQNHNDFTDFEYSNLEVCIFPFEKISLTAVELSEEEKKAKWHPLLDKLPIHEQDGRALVWRDGIGSGYEPKTLRGVGDALILEVPYITYQHFKSSEFYSSGKTYESYRKGSMEQPSLKKWRSEVDETRGTYSLFFIFGEYPRQFDAQGIWPDVGGILVRPWQGQIQKYLYDKETGALKAPQEGSACYLEGAASKALRFSQDDSVLGFFNNAPGDTAVFDHSQVAGGFNLVSTDWVDWRRSVLHMCPSGSEPKILSVDGTPIPILGYIHGSWVDFTLSKKWTGLKVYVARIRIEASMGNSSKRSCNFVLNPDDLCDRREHQMTAEETRSLCSFLNPSLLRAMYNRIFDPPICTLGTGLPDKFKGVTVEGPSHNSDLVTELSRRDRFDNQLADIFWNEAMWVNRLDILNGQMKAETKKRGEWDESYIKSVRHWVRHAETICR